MEHRDASWARAGLGAPRRQTFPEEPTVERGRPGSLLSGASMEQQTQRKGLVSFSGRDLSREARRSSRSGCPNRQATAAWGPACAPIPGSGRLGHLYFHVSQGQPPCSQRAEPLPTHLGLQGGVLTEEQAEQEARLTVFGPEMNRLRKGAEAAEAETGEAEAWPPYWVLRAGDPWGEGKWRSRRIWLWRQRRPSPDATPGPVCWHLPSAKCVCRKKQQMASQAMNFLFRIKVLKAEEPRGTRDFMHLGPFLHRN